VHLDYAITNSVRVGRGQSHYYSDNPNLTWRTITARGIDKFTEHLLSRNKFQYGLVRR